MKYRSVQKAIFLKRPNRFVAHVRLEGREEIVHVKNTGRCKEILVEGTPVVLEDSCNKERKTRYSLIAGYKGDTLINIDSQVPNAVVYEAIKNRQLREFSDAAMIKREVGFENSRFDLYFEGENRKGFIEVKGATLEMDGVAMFPDAPTERGTRHVYEMIKAVEQGYEGYILFLVQMKGIRYFTPYAHRDPDFAKALRIANEKGVTVIAYDAVVTEDEIVIGEKVEVRLDDELRIEN